MPEVVEVDIQCVQLNEMIVGKEIKFIQPIGESNIIRLDELEKSIVEGSKVVDVFRNGKKIAMKIKPSTEPTADFYILETSLLMTGSYIFNNLDLGHPRVIIRFSDNDRLYYSDSRKWGFMKLYEYDDYMSNYISTAPVDVLKNSSDLIYELVDMKEKYPELMIKSALMNQGHIAGLGNVYAQESLFSAGITPHRMMKDITVNELHRLAEATDTLLKEAYRLGGLSMRDYFQPNGYRGQAQLLCNVYRKKSCKSCGTLVDRVSIDGRSTYYCNHCQK
ncbi:hypothetical protein CEW46_27485 [Bacillus cereus]|nr:hypothetical protein CEW46_27485 [Bacillus cereus]